MEPRAFVHVPAELRRAQSTLSILFHGNTYPLRQKFDSAGLGGSYDEPDEEGRQDYYRIPDNIDLTIPEEMNNCQDLLTTTIEHTLIRCNVRSGPADGAGAAFLNRLRQLPQLRF